MKRTHVTGWVIVISMTALVAILFAQYMPTERVASVYWSEQQNQTVFKHAEWTMPSGTSGAYKVEPTNYFPGEMFTVLIEDITTHQNVLSYDFTASVGGCPPASPPTVNLVAQHSYDMSVDIPLGFPRDPLDEDITYAKARIFYNCPSY